MRLLLLAISALILTTCTNVAQREFEQGAVTPYAASQLTVSPTRPSHREPEVTAAAGKQIEERLAKLAAEWKLRARRSPADPIGLGFPAGKAPTTADLQGPLSPELVFAAAHGMSPAIRSMLRSAARASRSPTRYTSSRPRTHATTCACC